MTRFTTEEIEAIRKRAEMATEGPWRDNFGSFVDGIEVWSDGGCILSTEGGIVRYSDAEFIANAREDIPKLLTEVEHLTGVIGTLRSKLQLIDGCTYGVPNELTKGAIRYADEELR